MTNPDSFDIPSTKARDLNLGEYHANLARVHGALAAKFLFRGQWAYQEPEWFDHRLHLLDPDKYFNDFWTASADNVIRVLPYNGILLDLCSGDGFYDYHFYRHRADAITCIEDNPEAHALAITHHHDPKITHILDNIFNVRLPDSYFDVVLIRGAIEHFSEEDQQRIFNLAHRTLKIGGCFCGDTPAKRPGQDKMLAAHEHEWKDEQEMWEALGEVFTFIETWSLVSTERTTLFWRCRK